MRSTILAVLLAAAFLAGCTGGSSGGSKGASSSSGPDFNDLGLQASSTTGVLRGVVVDAAIRPVVGASVSLAGPDVRNATSQATGAFGFSNLQPGDYFISVTKPGFQAAQAAATVVAGVDDPPIVKVLLQADPSSSPYVSTMTFEGFIECSGSFVAAGLAACSAAGLPNDKFIVNYTVDRLPQWVQSEVVWETTQAVSPNLDAVYSVQGDSVLLDNPVEDRGPSPLLLQANETMGRTLKLDNGTDLLIRVFNEPIEGTRPTDPVGGDSCVDRPVLGGCLTGVGFTLEQPFTILTNVFYGYAPPPEWRYADDGPYAPPQ